MVKQRNIRPMLAVAIFWLAPALAHTPLCDCFDNGDDTITCEGGFSDGAAATGLPIRVLDERQKILLDGRMDDASTYSFDRPDVDVYIVVFDAGEGHTVTIFSDDIF
jgi:hypothetical protein